MDNPKKLVGGDSNLAFIFLYAGKFIIPTDEFSDGFQPPTKLELKIIEDDFQLHGAGKFTNRTGPFLGF